MSATAASDHASRPPVPAAGRMGGIPLGYGLAAAIAIVAIIAAVGWGAARTLDVISRPDHFPRVTVPGATAISITALGAQVIYYEGTAKPSLDRLDLRVLDPSGQPVAVAAYRGDLRYDHAGLVANAVGTFPVRRAGRYRVFARAAPEATAKLAVGEDLGGAMQNAVLWAGLVAVAGILAAAATALLTNRRRRA